MVQSSNDSGGKTWVWGPGNRDGISITCSLINFEVLLDTPVDSFGEQTTGNVGCLHVCSAHEPPKASMSQPSFGASVSLASTTLSIDQVDILSPLPRHCGAGLASCPTKMSSMQPSSMHTNFTPASISDTTSVNSGCPASPLPPLPASLQLVVVVVFSVLVLA